MAAKDLHSVDIRQQELEDITTCCICTEVYTDPKALPCIHTFCMRCLQENGLKTSKGPGDEMPCPLCRRMFKIPLEGFRELPKNVFIERLIQVANLSDKSSSSIPICDACVEENKEEPGKEIPAAETCCVECNQKFCAECCRQHRKFKLTKDHKLVPINKDEGGQNMMANLAPSVCELHQQKVLDVYCADCKTVMCAFCFIDHHKNHEGSDVKKYVDGFLKHIEGNAEAINLCRAKAETKKAELLKVKEDIQERVVNLEYDVEMRKDELKQFTDEHTASVLHGLYSIRQSRLKEIQMEIGDIDTCLSCLETYNSYCQKIMARGSAGDICGAFSDLCVRAVELQEQCQLMIEREIQSFKFCFRQSELEEFLKENCGNLIGEIQEGGDSKPKKRSKQSPLAELNNENNILRKEIEILRIDKESLQLASEKFGININKQVQTNKALTEELNKEKVNNDARMKQMEQELNNNKMTNNILQANHNKLKQELDKEKISNNCLQANKDKVKLELDQEKMANNSLQASNNKLVQEVNMYKMTIRRLEDNVEKLTQELETTKAEQLRYKSDPVLVKTIRTKTANEMKKDICGVTILDNELFFVSGGSSVVKVYDSIKLSFSRRWNLKELIDPMDIGSCYRNKCLYIFDFKGIGQSKEILRVDSKGNLIKKWSTGNNFGYGLSVTDESNVILAVSNENKLNEYSPNGQLIRDVNLSLGTGSFRPLHAIKLTNGHFVVCHGWDDCVLHGVCIVDTDGNLKKSFGGKRGSTIRQMNRPFHLSIDRNGFVMVADSLNSRVLILESDLEFRKEIVSKEEKQELGLRHPHRIILDESNGRMFVADNELNSDGQILIFKFK